MTLRGMQAKSEEGTLDITDLRFSPGQVAAIITTLLALFGSLGVTVWRVEDIGHRVEKIEQSVATNTQMLASHSQMLLNGSKDDERMDKRIDELDRTINRARRREVQ